jgi:hypothetical protein
MVQAFVQVQDEDQGQVQALAGVVLHPELDLTTRF